MLEEAIRRRLNEPDIRLVMRCRVPYDMTSQGRILLGDEHFDPENEEVKLIIDLAQEKVRGFGDLFAANVDGAWRGDHWEIYAEVQGERVIEPSEVKAIEEHVSGQSKHPVHLRAWSRAELVVTNQRNLSTKDFLENQQDKSSYGKIRENLDSLLKRSPDRSHGD